MACPPRSSVDRLFLSLVNDLADVPLAESLVSFACRRLAHRAAHWIACFFPPSTSCSPRRSPNHLFLRLLTACPARRSLHRLFVLLVNVLPAASLAASLVSFTRRRLARRAAR
jgi:hypothetical protein